MSAATMLAPDAVLDKPGESVEPAPNVTEPKIVPEPPSVWPLGTV